MSTKAPATTNRKSETPAPAVSSPPSTESLVRVALDDIALVVGGAAAVNRIDDDLTWTLMARIDRIRIRLLRDLKGIARHDMDPTIAQPPRIHGAVDEFIARNRVGMGK